MSHRIGLCQELLGYFGLFLIRFCEEGKLSGKERRNAGQPGGGEGRCGRVLRPQDAGDTPEWGWCVGPTSALSPWVKSGGMGSCVCVQGEVSDSREVVRTVARHQVLPATAVRPVPSPAPGLMSVSP